MKKRFLSAVLCLCLLPVGGVAAAGANTAFFAAETFDDEVTNSMPDAVELSDMGKARVVKLCNRSKGLLLWNNGFDTQVKFDAQTENQQYIIGMDFSMPDSETDFALGLEIEDKTYYPVRFERGEIYAHDGRKIGRCRKGQYYNLSLAVDAKRGYYSVYLDSKLLIENKSMKSLAAKMKKICVKKDNADGRLVVDNIYAYAGERLCSHKPESEFNPMQTLYIDLDYNCGDKSFFNSDIITEKRGVGSYEGVVMYPKTNSITAHRLTGRFDAHREDNDIVFEKSTSDDCYMDINTNVKRDYPYYLTRADFRLDKMGAAISPMYIRYTENGVNQSDEGVVRITADGQVILANGRSLMQLTNGEWVNIAVCYDMQAKTADVYINGEQKAKGVAFNKSIKRLSMVRCSMNTGTGSGIMHTRSYEVIAMSNNYIPDDSNKESVFYDEAPIVEYLKDKIAVHGYSGSIAVCGIKYNVENGAVADEDKKEVFVGADYLKLGYGIECSDTQDGLRGSEISAYAGNNTILYKGTKYTLKNAPILSDGIVKIPLGEFAEKVLGRYISYDGNGLMLTSESRLDIDYSNEVPEYQNETQPYEETYAKSINWYMGFDRPKAAELEKTFNELNDGGAKHPRIFADADDFARIKKLRETDKTINAWIEERIKAAESRLSQPLVEYEIYDNQRITDRTQEIRNRIEDWAFAYQITGDRKYVERGWQEIENCNSYPDWNPSHMIDLAPANAAYALFYDWCYDALSEEQRSAMYETVKSHSLEVVNSAFYGRLATGKNTGNYSDAFVKWKSNFNTIVNGSSIMAALAFAERDPKMCFEVLQNCIRSMEYTVFGFATGGAWSEGPDYWSYMMPQFSAGMGSLLSVMKDDYKLMHAPGVSQTHMYHIATDTFLGSNNYHDANPQRHLSYGLSWLADVYDMPECFAYRKQEIDDRVSSPTIYDIIYYQDDADGFSALPRDIYIRGVELVTSRASYEDHDGMYFSAHGGLVSSYHSHADIGTFVFDLNGKRWASDLGKEDYNLIASKGAIFSAIYRQRPEAHNIVVFNPEYYQEMSSGYAQTVEYESKPRGTVAVYDLQQGWSKQTDKYIRGFKVGDDRHSLTVRDEFTAKESIPVYWFMTTLADVEIIDNNTAILKQGNEELKLVFESDISETELSVGPAQPLETSMQLDGQNKNDGYSRIIFKGSADAGKQMHIEAKMFPAYEDYQLEGKEINEWTIPDGEQTNNENLSVKKIYADGRDISLFAKNNNIITASPDRLPVITAEASDPSKRVEIIQAENVQDNAKVRIYSDTDKEKYREYIVTYEVFDQSATQGYSRYEIKDIEVSSTPEQTNVKENMIDNDYTTRWTAFGVGENAVFDIGEISEIDAVAVALWNGDSRQYSFEIQVSADGYEWISVKNGKNVKKTEALELVELPPQKARYVKFINNGNTVNTNINILEFTVLKRNG